MIYKRPKRKMEMVYNMQTKNKIQMVYNRQKIIKKWSIIDQNEYMEFSVSQNW